MKELFLFVSGQLKQVTSLIETKNQIFLLKRRDRRTDSKGGIARAGVALMIFLILVLIVSCQKEEPGITPDTGTLIVDIGLLIQIDEVSKKLKSTQTIENFKVIIYKSDGTEALIFETESNLPDTLKLEPGEYYVEAHSDNNLPAAFENPYYYGASGIFNISSNTQQTIVVNCELANTIVSVEYSDNTIRSFIDYNTTVSTASGTLIFTKDETRSGYFQTSSINISVELSSLDPEGTESIKTLSGSISSPLKNKHYKIYVDASIDEGIGTFQIILNDQNVPVEVIEITDVSDDQKPGRVGYGDLLITEIMFDPSALSDTDGEWFEIYNNSDQSVNLQNLIVERDDINRYVINDTIELSPGEYLVLARTEIATEAPDIHIYGSAILLPNSGAELAIYNEDTETGSGALIFSVNYGGEYYPSPAGATISLDPGMLNASDAVLGSSWCVSESVYSTGDKGTPGVVNDLCAQE